MDWSTAHARPGASPRRPVSNSPVRAAVPPELQDHLGALVFSLTVDFTSTHRTISSQCGNRSRKRCSRAQPDLQTSFLGVQHWLKPHVCTREQSPRPGGWNALVNQAFCLGRGWAASPASLPWGGGGLFPQIKYGCCSYRGNRCSLI